METEHLSLSGLLGVSFDTLTWFKLSGVCAHKQRPGNVDQCMNSLMS